jgi:hypothetical protein
VSIALEKFKGMRVIHSEESFEGKKGFVLEDEKGTRYFYDEESQKYYTLKEMEPETFGKLVSEFPDCAMEMGIEPEEVLWTAVKLLAERYSKVFHPFIIWCHWVKRDSLTWKKFVNRFNTDKPNLLWMDTIVESYKEVTKFAKEFVHPKEVYDFLDFCIKQYEKLEA